MPHLKVDREVEGARGEGKIMEEGYCKRDHLGGSKTSETDTLPQKWGAPRVHVQIVRSLKAIGGKSASRLVRTSWRTPRSRTTTPTIMSESVKAPVPGGVRRSNDEGHHGCRKPEDSQPISVAKLKPITMQLLPLMKRNLARARRRQL